MASSKRRKRHLQKRLLKQNKFVLNISIKKRNTKYHRYMEDVKLYTLEEALDEHFGKVGTPRRDAHEAQVAEAVYAYQIGEAIKKARLEQNLTQEQLGEKIGVQRAQISRLENGRSISLTSMSRIFKALGFATASLDLGTFGKVALW